MLEEWNLSKPMCAMLLRNGASNAVKATSKLNLPNMSCVAHSIHLVVGTKAKIEVAQKITKAAKWCDW